MIYVHVIGQSMRDELVAIKFNLGVEYAGCVYVCTENLKLSCFTS